MKRTKHLQQLMNYYLDEEIEHFRKNYEYNEENIDNHIKSKDCYSHLNLE